MVLIFQYKCSFKNSSLFNLKWSTYPLAIINDKYSSQLSLSLAWSRLSLVVELKEENSNRAEPIPENVLV